MDSSWFIIMITIAAQQIILVLLNYRYLIVDIVVKEMNVLLCFWLVCFGLALMVLLSSTTGVDGKHQPYL